MARKRAFKPSFYKILIDFAVKLQLPEKFMEKYGAKLPRNVKLRMASGSGATWEVAVEKQRERYSFSRGWAEFSRDMRLRRFQLVVFAYAGNATFHVTTYATSALEKTSG